MFKEEDSLLTSGPWTNHPLHSSSLTFPFSMSCLIHQFNLSLKQNPKYGILSHPSGKTTTLVESNYLWFPTISHCCVLCSLADYPILNSGLPTSSRFKLHTHSNRFQLVSSPSPQKYVKLFSALSYLTSIILPFSLSRWLTSIPRDQDEECLTFLPSAICFCIHPFLQAVLLTQEWNPITEVHSFHLSSFIYSNFIFSLNYPLLSSSSLFIGSFLLMLNVKDGRPFPLPKSNHATFFLKRQ